MNRFLAYLLALLLIAAASTPATAQRVGMIQSLSYPSSVGNLRTATDPAGNTYYVGCFQDRIDIAGTVMTALPAGDQSVNIYFAKFDAAGQLQWLRQGGSPGTGSMFDGHEIVYDVALDGAGALYVAGISREGAQFGTTTLDSVGTFLVKLDAATGNFLWARLVGHGTSVGGVHPRSYLVDIAATPTDVYFSGSFIDNDDLDGIPLQNAHLAQSLVVGRCSPGIGFQPGIITAVWQCVPTDTLSRSGAGDICVSPTGGLVITGGYTGTVRFGGEAGSPTHTAARISPYGYEYFIVRLTPSALGGSTQEVIDRLPLANTLALDAQANCYFTGYVPQGDSIGNVVAADSGMYVARLDRAPGRGVRWLNIAHAASRAATFYFKLVLHPSTGRLYGVGQLNALQVQLGAYSLTNPTGNFGAFAASLDTAAGAVQWARAFTGDGINSVNLPMGLGVDASSRAYLAGITNFGNFSPAMTFDGLTIRAGSAYLMRIDPGAQVTGTAYLDQNANGARDAGEPAFPRPVVVQDAAAGTVATSGPNGLYHAVVPIGNYALAAVPPAYYTVSAPATNQQTGNIAVLGQVDVGRDFGIAPTPNQTDVRVTFTPVGRARQGFVNRYRARVENLGTTPVSGTVRVTLDAATPYTGVQPTPATLNGAVATWNFAQLAPFGILTYDIAATVPLNVPLNTPLHSSATVAVAADVDATNDADSVQQFVVGSFDPNDLAVNYSSLTPAQIAANTPLDYTIRFQNMGNDTAFTVVITDTLPEQLLRLGTLQLVSSSHNCWWTLRGNNQLVIRFDSINLRPQSQSALGSMGFVRFWVTPHATLTPGMLIPNQAHIVFDYNAPLATNGVTTLVQTPNGLVAAESAAAWSLYPNPAGKADRVTLTADVPTSGLVSVSILDALGRTVRTEAVAAPAGSWIHTVPTADLTPGVYAVRLTLPGGARPTRRLVVR